VLSVIGLVSVQAQLGTFYSSTYEDCVAISNMFDYTYSAHQTGVYATPYESAGYEYVTCNNPGRCPDGVIRATCAWLRYLQVHCRTTSDPSQSTVEVYTNSVPNHCYYAETTAFTASDTDFSIYGFSMDFNLPTHDMKSASGLSNSATFYNRQVKTQTDIDTMSCDSTWATPSSIDANINYMESIGKMVVSVGQNSFDTFYSTASGERWTRSSSYPYAQLSVSDSVVGIALNGVFIFAGAAETTGMDTFFPKGFGASGAGRIALDNCLGS
jgi:hypothetical protein